MSDENQQTNNFPKFTTFLLFECPQLLHSALLLLGSCGKRTNLGFFPRTSDFDVTAQRLQLRSKWNQNVQFVIDHRPADSYCANDEGDRCHLEAW